MMNFFKISSAFVVLAALPFASAQPIPGGDETGLRIQPANGSDAVGLEWWAESGNFYFLEHSSNLFDWTFLPVMEAGADGLKEWGFSTNADAAFFRLRYTDDITHPLLTTDYDGDGLSAYQEFLLGSDPFEPDSSGDGIFDGIAWKLGLGLSLVTPEPDPSDTTPPTIELHAPLQAIAEP